MRFYAIRTLFGWTYVARNFTNGRWFVATSDGHTPVSGSPLACPKDILTNPNTRFWSRLRDLKGARPDATRDPAFDLL